MNFCRLKRARPEKRGTVPTFPTDYRSPHFSVRKITMNDILALWEVFVQLEGGGPHEHAGSVRAADKELALQNARDTYARRGKVISIWVVPATYITASQPEDIG